MKKYLIIFALIASTGLFGDISSESEMHYQPSSPQNNYLQEKNFKLSSPPFKFKEKEIQGEIVDIQQKEISHMAWPSSIITVRTKKETFTVLLGPTWYVSDDTALLYAGDYVKVKGWIRTMDGKPMMIAKELNTDNFNLRLRDSNGFPYWSGWKKS